MKYIVYKVTNRIDGKFYIGYTSKNIEERFEKHCKRNKGKSHFQHALHLYGFENFQSEILFESDDKQTILDMEQTLIVQLDARNPAIGYNVAPGGQGGPTEKKQPTSEATKEKRRLARLGKKHSLQTREKMKGKIKSKETREKLSNAMKGRIFSKETIDKMRRPRGGRKQKNKSEYVVANKTTYSSETHPKSKPISINDVMYPSILNASKAIDMGTHAITNAINKFGRHLLLSNRMWYNNDNPKVQLPLIQHSTNKSITINNVVYASISLASRTIGLNKRSLLRIISKFGHNLNYINNEWSANDGQPTRS
jgi:group I intron endonuclease